jgi:hypothetical protein
MSRHVLLPAGLVLALAACAQTSGEGAPGTCGAEARQDLVGQTFTVLNDAELPEDTRVLFPGAVTAEEDNQPGRLNITIDTDDVIGQVYCG